MLTIEKQTEKLQLTVGGEFQIYLQQRLAHQKLCGGTGDSSVASQTLPLILSDHVFIYRGSKVSFFLKPHPLGDSLPQAPS